MSTQWCFHAATTAKFFFILTWIAAICRGGAEARLEPGNQVGRWNNTYTLKTWSGYKDNVLFSAQHPVGSPFAAIGADVFLWRPPEQSWDVVLLASGEYTCYIPGSEVTKEVTAFGQVQAKRPLGDAWQFGISLNYLFFDQVFDNSEFDQAPSSLQLQGHTFTVQPSLRWKLSQGTFAEAEFTLSRQAFRAVVDGEWQAGPKFSLGRTYGNRSEIDLGILFIERQFDNRKPRSADGLSTVNKSLDFQQVEPFMAWKCHWDRDRHWRTSTRLSFLRNSDNDSGFFNYDRYRLAGQARYRGENFQFRAELKLSYYEYALQHAGAADLSNRRRTLAFASIRAERELAKDVKLFAEYSHERLLSNLRSDTFQANTLSAGIEVEF